MAQQLQEHAKAATSASETSGTENGRGYDQIALVLQGGGALGAYQVGVYRGLHASGFLPDWVAGISIGAMNGAIIAGNPPPRRLGRLREFWDAITHESLWPRGSETSIFSPIRDLLYKTQAMVTGQPGFFRPRFEAALAPLLPKPPVESTGYLDPAPLRATLERVVDFDWLNSGETRLSLGVVNVRTGEQRFFDSREETIGINHVMASCALPPAFPAVEIDGEYYWDGGIYSNTPLDALLDEKPYVDTLCFMVDLVTAAGPLPRSVPEARSRKEEITFASRAVVGLAQCRAKHDLRRIVGELIDRLPEEALEDPEVQAMAREGTLRLLHVVRVAYRDRNPRHQEFDFARPSVRRHLEAGYEDACSTCKELRELSADEVERVEGDVILHELTTEGSQETLKRGLGSGEVESFDEGLSFQRRVPEQDA